MSAYISKKILIILLMIPLKFFMQEDHLYTNLLKKYITDGLVNYENLKDDIRLNKYLDQLSSTNPDELSPKKKLAFWINVYNAFTLQIVCENYPIESITDLNTGGKIISYVFSKTVWDKEYVNINNKKYSLNDIEHNILRKMNEPRIHFAVVCASISCPKLRNEAYESEKIESQLNDQADLFINDTTKNSFDLNSQKAELSKIFDWFEEDFGNTDESVLKFLADYLPESLQNDINENAGKWEIDYKDYNWKLNKQY